MDLSDHSKALDFFNGLSATLEIQLTEPASQIAENLANLKASPQAEIAHLSLEAKVFNEEDESFRALTPEELSIVILPISRIQLKGESGDIVEHKAPNGKDFTIKDLIKAVEETERKTRGDSEWFGGIDVHHVFFEGIYQDEDDKDVWEIWWGS